MKQAKATMMRVTRWLLVLAAALIVSSGNVLVAAQSPGKSACTESCAKRCPCCISKSAPADSSAPLAPTPSSRTTVAKDFQLVALYQALLPKGVQTEAIVPTHLTVPHFSVSLPVFVRHCSFLI